MFRITRDTIAEFGGLTPEATAACQRALVNRKETWDALSCNPDLTPETWKRLWGSTRPGAVRAKSLVGRALPRDLREVVLDKETRVSVLTTFIEHNELDEDQQRRLLEKSGTGEHLLKMTWMVEELRKDAAITAGGAALLRELAYSPTERFSDEEVLDLMEHHQRWSGFLDRPSSTNARALRVLFGRRSAAGEGLLKSAAPRGEMLTALAGSANLTEEQARRIAKIEGGVTKLTTAEIENLRYCLMALVANPRCPLDVVNAFVALSPRPHDVVQAGSRRSERAHVVGSIKDLSDSEQIEWLINRSCPSNGSFGYRQGRPVELLELFTNPHLSDEQRHRIRTGLDEDLEPALRAMHEEIGLTPPAAPEKPARQGLPEWYTTAVAGASIRLGSDQQRWETLIGLLDDFEGSFDELVELAETI